MRDLLFWLYLINAMALIIHEMDSAYWKEWELFHLPGGVAGFLLLHIPLLLFVLYGLVQVDREVFAGQILSLVLSLAGIFCFFDPHVFHPPGTREVQDAGVPGYSLGYITNLLRATWRGVGAIGCFASLKNPIALNWADHEWVHIGDGTRAMGTKCGWQARSIEGNTANEAYPETPWASSL